MISAKERAYILEHAYLPEHLPAYVSAISKKEPHLCGDFVVHLGNSHLVFVGYPLQGAWQEDEMMSALKQAQTQFEPMQTSILTPECPAEFNASTTSSTDAYYRLALKDLTIPKKTRNMLRRAQQEISIHSGQFGREHKKILRSFLRKSEFDPATRYVFKRLPAYLKSGSAHLYDARTTSGRLVAFDVADFSARQIAFYMFNLRSPRHNIPGTSDLLLAHIIQEAQKRGLDYLNMGLGINPGIAFFKKKWGATVYFKYMAFEQDAPDRQSLLGNIDQFTR